MNIPIELQDKIKRIANLPTLPQVACGIMDQVNNPKASSNDIASIVSQDISLSAKILRLANSAFYGMPRTIANINEAIVILGFKVIFTMVLSLTVFDMFPHDKRSAQFDRKKFWQHCLICGLISKLIAENIAIRRINPEEAFCAGLLHDIGKIVMEQYLHDDLHRAIDYGNKSGKSFYQSESDLLGYTHSNVAEWMILRWNLPEVLSFPIVHHHTPGESSGNDGSQVTIAEMHTHICHIADYESYNTQIMDNASTMPPPDLQPESLETIGLSKKQLTAIHEQLPEKLEQLTVFYDLFSS